MKLKLLNNDFSELLNQIFLDQWKQLYNNCSWATPFQSPEFVTTWFDSYQRIYSPIIIGLEDDARILVGLLVLATSKQDGQLVVAGAHQAEYQSWLASPDCPNDFLMKVFAALDKENLRTETLRFKYLPKNAPINHIVESTHYSKLIEHVIHQRPLMRIDHEDIEKSFKKKSNKSRFNRLKRLGEFEFKKISDMNEIATIFDQLVSFYDLRQGAINNSFPFQDDAQKKDFHLDWLKKHPELLHITVSLLDNQLVSAHIGIVGKNIVHLAILAYSPFYATHSPGKLHLMQLARQLSEDNIEYLDLTPGGDPWKERFANDYDEVCELIIYQNLKEKIIQNAKNKGLDVLKKCLKPLSITPDRCRQLFAAIKRVKTKSIINRLQFFTPKTIEMRIYRHTLASSQGFASEGRMKKDDLDGLLKFNVIESWQSKQSFCSSALENLENGEHSYSFSSEDKLLHYGWLIEEQRDSFISEVQQAYQYPPKSAVLYDFYTDPDARGQGLYQENIKQILTDAAIRENAEYIYISVNADNIPSRHVIEKLGFEYQESLFIFKLLSFSKKWKNYNSAGAGE